MAETGDMGVAIVSLVGGDMLASCLRRLAPLHRQLILSARAVSGMTRAVKPAAWPAVTLWIVLMETAWSLGEAIGYLRGGGRSLEAWR